MNTFRVNFPVVTRPRPQTLALKLQVLETCLKVAPLALRTCPFRHPAAKEEAEEAVQLPLRGTRRQERRSGAPGPFLRHLRSPATWSPTLYCLRHYRRRLLRWVNITKEYLPPGEQALRALEQLKGEAETELEEISDTRYNCPEGIELLLKDLEVSFGEKELFRQGGVIREFEGITRLQGESVTAFVRRFRLLERKLTENRVPAYPEPARVIKRLDGLRLDEKSTSSLLLAAGNPYEMSAIQDAIKIQYPAGMSITGLPRGRPDLRKRPAASSTSSSRASIPLRDPRVHHGRAGVGPSGTPIGTRRASTTRTARILRTFRRVTTTTTMARPPTMRRLSARATTTTTRPLRASKPNRTTTKVRPPKTGNRSSRTRCWRQPKP